MIRLVCCSCKMGRAGESCVVKAKIPLFWYIQLLGCTALKMLKNECRDPTSVMSILRGFFFNILSKQ